MLLLVVFGRLIAVNVKNLSNMRCQKTTLVLLVEFLMQLKIEITMSKKYKWMKYVLGIAACRWQCQQTVRMSFMVLFALILGFAKGKGAAEVKVTGIGIQSAQDPNNSTQIQYH